jgi:uncharacterized small protein (DUF1192 family)
MSKTSYAEDIKSAEVMSAGLKNNAAQVAKSGLDEAFATGLDSKRSRVVALNNEQERLKADLKEKTETLATELAELNATVMLARKKIKLDFPKARWVEFGIDATR